MRQEGNLWVAYYALSDTMDGSLFLGSIQMAAVQDPGRRTRFMDLMKETVSDILKGCFVGAEPSWTDPVRAPEHERSGRS